MSLNEPFLPLFSEQAAKDAMISQEFFRSLMSFIESKATLDKKIAPDHIFSALAGVLATYAVMYNVPANTLFENLKQFLDIAHNSKNQFSLHKIKE